MKKRILILIFLCLSMVFISPTVYALKLSIGLIPDGTPLPSQCKKGETYIETSDNLMYFCYAKDSWKVTGTSIGDYALESVFGTELNADDLENDGGVLKTAAEIPHIDVAHTWPADQIFSAVGWTPLTSATFPGSPVVNKWYLVDGTTSDPSVLEIGIPYWCIWNGSNCIAMMSNIGTLNVSAIATPTLLAAELDDAENPHTLIAGELMNKIISNVSGVMHLDPPAESEGWNVIFHCGGTDNYVIDPTDSADWYLNGTSIGATSSISNTACTIGEDMTCYSTGTKVFCKTTDSFVDLDD